MMTSNDDVESALPDRPETTTEGLDATQVGLWGSKSVEKGGYDILLRFTSPDLRTRKVREAFATYKSSGYNLAFMFFVLGLSSIYFAIRANLDQLWYAGNPFWFIGFACGAVLFVSLSVVLWVRLVLVSFHYPRWLGRLEPHRKATIAFSRSFCGRFIEECALYSCVATGEFYLLARTIAGPCRSDATIWETQRCNPAAQYGMVPIDQLLVALLIIPLFQYFVRGASNTAVILCCGFSLCMTNICLALVGSHGTWLPNHLEYFIWVNFSHLVMFCVSYEVERCTVVNFINLVLLRRAHAERLSLQSRLLEADVTTKDLLQNLNMITSISDEVRGPLQGACMSLELLQRKLLAAHATNKPINNDPINLAGAVLENIRSTVESLDDLVVLGKITSPQARQLKQEQTARNMPPPLSPPLLPPRTAPRVRHADEATSDAAAIALREQAASSSSGIRAEDGDDADDDSADSISDADQGLGLYDEEVSTIFSSSRRGARSLRTHTSSAGATGSDPRLMLHAPSPLPDLSDDDSVTPVVNYAIVRGSTTRPWVKFGENEALWPIRDARGGSGDGFIRRMDSADRSSSIRRSSGTRSKETVGTRPTDPASVEGVTPRDELLLSANSGGVDPTMHVSACIHTQTHTAVAAAAARMQLPMPPPPPRFSASESFSYESGRLSSASVVIMASPGSAFVQTRHTDIDGSTGADLGAEWVGRNAATPVSPEDCRVLSDEVAAALPSPVAVMFPFAASPSTDNGASEHSEFSYDREKVASYLTDMASKIAVEVQSLHLERQRRATARPESPTNPTPAQLLRRMVPAALGGQAAGPLPMPQYAELCPENNRLLDVVDEVSFPATQRARALPPYQVTVQALTAAASGPVPPMVLLRSLLVTMHHRFTSVAAPPASDDDVSGFVELLLDSGDGNDHLHVFLTKLFALFYRDMRCTCHTFEFLLSHLDPDDAAAESEGGGLHGATLARKKVRLMDDPARLGSLEEYLSVVRLLLVQTSASLLTAIDNVLVIKGAADAHHKMLKKKHA